MKIKITLLTSFVLFVMACHTTQTTPPAKQIEPTPASVRINDIWVLETLNGFALEKDSFNSEKPRIEINTKEKMYFGYSGCNNIHGKLELTETAIHFLPGPMTHKACIEGNIEPAFINALLSSATYTIGNGKLNLKNAEGKLVCVFRKVD